MKKEYLQTVSDFNLIQMYCNCALTFMDARPNSEEEHINLVRSGVIVREIFSRGLDIPTQSEVRERGIFKGEGTF